MARLIEITGKAIAGEWGTDDEIGNGIPVLRTTNFTNEGVINYTNVVTRTITKKNIEEKFLCPGDIIIEKSGGSDKYPVGRVVYFDGPEKTYLFNNFTGLLRVQDLDNWFPKYVFYSLFGNYRRGGTIQYENKTTGLHNLKTDDYVSMYEVTDADYSSQIKVCTRLDKVYSLIKMREQQLQLLDTLIKARFVEMCNDNPTHNHLRDFINRYNAERCGDRVLPVLSITKLDGMVLQSDKFSKRIASTDSSAYKVVPRGKLVQGIHIDERNFDIQDIVDVGIVSPAYKIWSVNCEKCIPSVLAFALRTDKTMNYIRSRFTGSVRRRESISFDDFMNTPIDLPSMYFQEQFASFVSQVDKSKLLTLCTFDERILHCSGLP